jgi:hypothetical protein
VAKNTLYRIIINNCCVEQEKEFYEEEIQKLRGVVDGEDNKTIDIQPGEELKSQEVNSFPSCNCEFHGQEFSKVLITNSTI